MKKTLPRAIAVASVLAAVAMIAVAPWPARGAEARYPKMAPLDQYLMADRAAEIALARTAAPDAISRDATILVLGRHGFETAVTGKNGFVCYVDRSWTSEIDMAEVWNPHIRAPQCLNPPAVRTILPLTLKISAMVLAGESKSEMVANLEAAYRSKQLPQLEPGALSYMMSKRAYLTDDGSHNFGHVMLFAIATDGSLFGADLTGAPFASMSFWFPNVSDETLGRALPPIRIFMIGVRHWSDGSRQ